MAVARPRIAVLSLLVLGALAWLAGATGTRAASPNVVVDMSIPSATYLSIDPIDSPAGNCLTNTPQTVIGTVLPGTGGVTGQNCVVVFGSSNDTSMLQVRQTDGLGEAMFRPPIGPKPASGWDEGDGDQVAETKYAAGGQGGARALAQQPDGRVVVAGNRGSVDFGVARFNTNGTIHGQVVTSFTGGADYANDVALLPNGKLLVVGVASSGSGDVAIARYNADLTLDTNVDSDTTTHCSTDGRHVTDVGVGTADEAVRVLPVGDSSGDFIVVARSAGDTSLLRYDSTCALVASWGAGGIVTTSLAAGAEEAYDALLQADGKIVVLGSAPSGNADLLAARFNANGSLDTNVDAGPTTHWNTTGVRIVALTGSADRIEQAVLQPDGKVAFAGKHSGDNWLVGRFGSDGSWDNSFSLNGWDSYVPPSGCCKHASGIALEATGSVLVVGNYPGGHADTAVARWSSTGVRDMSFNGGAGIINHNVGSDVGQEYGYDAMIGRDGRMFVAIEGIDPVNNWSAMVLQLTTTTIPDYQDTVNEWEPVPTPLFGGCLHSVSGGATTDVGTWSATGACGMADTAPWEPITTTAQTVAKSPATDADAQANLRFGLHTSTTQAPGSYVAPITFDVVAPVA